MDFPSDVDLCFLGALHSLDWGCVPANHCQQRATKVSGASYPCYTKPPCTQKQQRTSCDTLQLHRLPSTTIPSHICAYFLGFFDTRVHKNLGRTVRQ